MPALDAGRRARLFAHIADDYIAKYVPWHIHPDEWGIYLHERTFWGYIHDLQDHIRKQATSRGPHLSTVARIAFETVLEHEYTHFESEVLGTQLEDVSLQPLYIDYLTWTTGHAMRLRALGT